ncbi:unnamed protein product, partial [Gulo gulo]
MASFHRADRGEAGEAGAERDWIQGEDRLLRVGADARALLLTRGDPGQLTCHVLRHPG